MTSKLTQSASKGRQRGWTSGMAFTMDPDAVD